MGDDQIKVKVDNDAAPDSASDPMHRWAQPHLQGLHRMMTGPVATVQGTVAPLRITPEHMVEAVGHVAEGGEE